MAESKIAVYGAITANVAIAATKFAVAAATGSSAMLSEAIHSTVDTGDGVLLLVGMHLSQREPSIEHPFGHGKELYFWSLIVAVLIFGLGGGMSVYEGVLHVLRPAALEDPGWSYLVLGAAALFEGTSLVIALREFNRTRGEQSFWRALHTSKDPTTFTVVAEDAAALIGLAFAAIGVYASHRFDAPVIDGAASIAIGVLLAGVAVLLLRESRGLLIGEGVRPETARAIRDLAARHPLVERPGRPLSMYMGPDQVLLTLDVQFREGASSDEVALAVREIERSIRDHFPKITRIYIEASYVAGSAAPARTEPARDVGRVTS
jgi:cation diffusion facilitator family transporter